ncbi:MAG: PQQ-binding-like beta-propeller repeat protein [Halanaeroarchaeum sp.]
MTLTRRRVLAGLGAAASVAGLAALAGCSSSCPDADPPTPAETVSLGADPVGPFDRIPEGTWNGPHGDAGLTGYAGASIPESGLGVRFRTALSLPSTDAGGLSASAPSVDGELLVVADERRVHALDSRTGNRRWQSAPVGPTTSDTIHSWEANTTTPALGAGAVYVGTHDGVVALDRADGTRLWDVPLPDAGTPTVAADGVYALGRRALVALSADGTVRWRRRVREGGPPAQPAVGGGRVVVPTDVGVAALERTRGEEAWTRPIVPDTHLAVADGTCFVGNAEGLWGLALADGDRQFAFSRSEYRAFLTPVVAPGTIYAVEQPGEAGAATFALDRGPDGPTPRWCSYVGSGAVTAATPTLALGITTLGQGPDAASAVVAFSRDLGETPFALASGSLPRDWVTPPAVLGDAAFVTTRGGTVVGVGRVS